MAMEGSSSSCVSGFVKHFKEIPNHGVVTFSVLRKNFFLPNKVTTFTAAIRAARKDRVNVLILFKELDGVTPEITGVITSPTWPQRKAASEGQSYEDLVNIGRKALLAKNQNIRVV